MSTKTFLILVVLITVVVATSCSGGLFGSDNLPATNQPQEPAAPVVVDGIRTSYADVVQKTSPAVVRIEALHKGKATSQMQFPGADDFFKQFQLPQQNQRPQVQRGAGSGVIVSADGTILTNHHVVKDAERITVLLNDNKTYEAKIVGTDQPSDLAVIKIEATELPFLTLGNSDNVRIGDIVLAIGNPLDIGQTVTAGIISAKGRRTGLSDGSFEDFLQTDAPINRGNSGGALVNLSGELIGINSQILGGPGGGSIGIGFSIPSNMAKSVMDQLIKDGKVRRGMLGINIQTPTEELAKGLGLENAQGVIIGSVRPGSAAEKAGLKRYDLITAINGEKMIDSNVLRNKVAGTPPGTEIKITILRDGKEMEFSATLDELKTDDKERGGRDPDEKGASPEKESGKLGLSLQPVTPEIARQLNLDSDNEGVVVTAVEQGGPAAEAGIGRGDVILEINRKSVNSADEVKSTLDSLGTKPIVLLVNRRGQTTLITIEQ